MQCDRAAELAGSYLDQELDAATRHEVAAHLGSCPACASLAEDLRRMSLQLAALGREPAPKHLAAEVQRRLAAAERPAPWRLAALQGWPTQAGLRQAAAAVLLVCLTAAATGFIVLRTAGVSMIEREVATAHVRSLLQDSPTQVASSEAHTVKPWFTGRLEFAPNVKDLAADGFPLAGARLDYIGERRVAALVYRRRLHVVNVFMWPSADGNDATPRERTHRGYNILTWRKGGIEYWAVSDLNVDELRLLQGQL